MITLKKLIFNLCHKIRAIFCVTVELVSKEQCSIPFHDPFPVAETKNTTKVTPIPFAILILVTRLDWVTYCWSISISPKMMTLAHNTSLELAL